MIQWFKNLFKFTHRCHCCGKTIDTAEDNGAYCPKCLSSIMKALSK